jgi:phage-related protein
MSTIQSLISTAWSTIVSLIQSAMGRLVGAIQDGAGRAVSAVTDMGGRLVSAVTSIGGRLYSAGASIISQLVDGIQSRIGAAVDAVRGAVSAITDLLPGSPAKTGPLSGRGYVLLRGRRFAGDLAQGINSRATAVQRAANGLAQAMAVDLGSSVGGLDSLTRPALAAAGAAGALGVPAGGTVIQVGGVSLTVTVGEGVDPVAARAAFAGAGDDLAEKLALALSRR